MRPDDRLNQLARRQYSVFTRRQALDAGVSRATLDGRLEHGLLTRLHNGVYLPAGVPIRWEQRAIGAQLACGPNAALAVRSAGKVWGFTDEPDEPEMAVPASTVRARPGIVIVRTKHLEVARSRGFVLTTPRRTILDLAAVLDEGSLERIIDDAHRRRLIDPAAFLTYVDGMRRPGGAQLRALLRFRRGAPMGSDAETILFRALRHAGLPAPVAQRLFEQAL